MSTYTISEVTDKGAWESFINEHSPQSFFQSWDWGDVSKKEGSVIERVGMYLEKTLVGIAQITTVKAKRGTFLHLRHGPILKNWTKEVLHEFLQYIGEYAKKKNAAFLRISPLITDSHENQILLESFKFRNAPIHAMDGEHVWALDIEITEEELLKNMRKTTRYLIKKAQTVGVKIERSNNIQDFYSLYDHTAKRHGFIQHKGIEEEFRVFGNNKNAILFTGSHDGKLIASAIVVFYGNQAIYRHGASIPSDIPAAYLIQWEAIKEAKKRGFKVYNFWGIAPLDKKSHPWKGISLFKIGFGGRVISYMHAQDKVYSVKYAATFALESIRRIKKGY